MTTRKFEVQSISTWPARTQNYTNVARKPQFEREYKAKVSPRKRRLLNKRLKNSELATSPIKRSQHRKCLKHINNQSRPTWFTPHPKENNPKLHLHRKPPAEQTTLPSPSSKAKIVHIVRPIEYEKIVAELLELLGTLKQQREDMRSMYHTVHQAAKLSEYIKGRPTEEIQQQILHYQELEHKLLYVLSELNKHIEFVRNKYYGAVQEAKRSRALLNMVEREKSQGKIKPKTLSINYTSGRNEFERRQDELNKVLLKIKYDSGEIDGCWKDDIGNKPEMIKLMKDFSKSRPDQMISYIMQAEKKVFKRKATAFSKKKKTSVNSKEEGKPKAFVPSKARPNTPIARSY